MDGAMELFVRSFCSLFATFCTAGGSLGAAALIAESIQDGALVHASDLWQRIAAMKDSSYCSTHRAPTQASRRLLVRPADHTY